MAPAAPIKCPVTGLVALTARRLAWSRKTVLMARVSTGSFKGVAEPWALM